MTEADQHPDRSPAMATLRAELAIPPDVPALQGEEDTVRLACWMLRVTQPWPEAVRETTEALLAAHRDGVEDPGEWRKLRRAAIGLSENDARRSRLSDMLRKPQPGRSPARVRDWSN